MEISVIVTVHNAEKYLVECLDSVLVQTFPDIEVLCMDGGSTDSSPEILKDYAERDRRIRIINDPDTSYGHKVNEGIRLAAGEYISVLESDDMYRADMLEKLIGVAKRYHPDYVDADYIEFLDAAGERYYSHVGMYRKEDYGILLESGKHPENMRQTLRYWTGLFKKEFLVREGIFMNESPGASFQDLSFRFLTGALAKTSYHIEVPVYLYRSDNPGSSVHDPRKALATADEFDFLKGELGKRNILNQHIWRHFYTWKYNDLYRNMARFEGGARDVLLDRTYRELEMDQDLMRENNYGEFSGAIWDFLEKSRREIAADIEGRYQNTRQMCRRRRALYEKSAGSRVVVFGCGAWGRELLKLFYLKQDKVLCCTDNAETLWGTRFGDKIVVPPKQAVRDNPDALFVVANKLYGDEIVMQLQRMGVHDGRIYRY